MIKRIDHIAIVVRNLEEGLNFYKEKFDLEPEKVETVPEQGVKAAIIRIGDTELELLEPIDPNSGVAKFLESRGEGIHHICFEVDDVNRELESLEAKGIQLIDKKGRKGLAGLVGFLHPKTTKGVLIELAQKVH